VLRREVGDEGISAVCFRPRGGGGGGGGACADKRFDVWSGFSVGTRGRISTDVTEVSESFRLGRGIGGFMVDGSDGWGGNSRRNEIDRSGLIWWWEVEADERVLLGAGGTGGKFRFVPAGCLSSGLMRSSEFTTWLLPLAPRFREGGGKGFSGDVCGIARGGKDLRSGGRIGCGLSRSWVSGECFTEDTLSSSSSSSEVYTNVTPVVEWSVWWEWKLALSSGFIGGAKVLGSDSVVASEWEPSLWFENMSRLNASTPRSTSGVRVIVDDEVVLEFTRKGFNVVLVGGMLGLEGSSNDDFDFVRSATRAITRQTWLFWKRKRYLERKSLTFLFVLQFANVLLTESWHIYVLPQQIPLVPVQVQSRRPRPLILNRMDKYLL
jgi:hypothetical protein